MLQAYKIHLVFGRCRSSVSEVPSNGLHPLVCTLPSKWDENSEDLTSGPKCPHTSRPRDERNQFFISVRNVRQQSQKM